MVTFSTLNTAEVAPSWARELGVRVQRARKRIGLTQQALADSAEISKVWVSRIERGRVQRPGARVLDQIASVLGNDVIPPRELSSVGSTERYPTTPFNVIGTYENESLGRDSTLVPVYRWGSAGDPRSTESSPDPDHEEHPPLGRESLVGPRGFGVLVRGESMARRDIHDGDTVWINPERPYRVGKPVLARIRDESGECGMVVKTLTRDERTGDLCLASECDQGSAVVICDNYEVIGPVVGISPAFRLPN